MWVFQSPLLSVSGGRVSVMSLKRDFGLTASMLGISKSVSTPNFKEANDSQRSPDTSRGSRYALDSSSENGQLQFVDTATSFTFIFPGRSTCVFRTYVLLLLGIQVSLASLQWMGATYRWRPHVTAAERSLCFLLLLLSWTNMTLGFFGFRRLQFAFPLNWIIFGCIFESLTLLVMCLRLIEQDITWPFILVGLGVVLVYSALGLWVPGILTANLWILILASMIVLVFSAIALGCSLQMRYYVPLSLCIMIFGPWAMYNSQCLFVPKKRTGYKGSHYLEAATKMFINYACTVGAIVFAHRFSADTLDVE